MLEFIYKLHKIKLCIYLSKQSSSLFEILQLFPSLSFSLFYFLTVVLSGVLHLLFLSLQFHEDKPSLFLFLGYLLEKLSLLDLWSLVLCVTTGLLLGFMFLDSLLDLNSVNLLLSEFLLFSSLVLLDFALSIVKDLVEKVDSGLLSFLPILLLFSFLLDSFYLDQSVKFFLICSKLRILVPKSCKYSSSLVSLLFL